MRVERFLCLQLRTAGVCLGWVGTVSSLINLIYTSQIVGIFNDMVPSANEGNKQALHIVLVIYLALNALDSVASILLIIGTIKEKHLLILPWLINCAVSLTSNVLTYIVAIVALAIQGNELIWACLLVTVIGGLVLYLKFLAWVAMYSLFKVFQGSVETQPLLPRTHDYSQEAYVYKA